MKYIVYLTTNLVNNYIYVGVHKTLNPDVFDGYIGNGVYITQPSTYKYSKSAFQIAVNEFGVKNFKRHTIAILEDEKEAYALEALIVNDAFLARPDVYNMILGGEIMDSNAKACYQYDENGSYITEYASITEAAAKYNVSMKAISNSIRFNFKSCGSFWSDEKVEQLPLINYAGSPASQPIYRYLETGEFDEEFSSISSAAAAINDLNINVSRSAKLGYKVQKFYFSFIKKANYADANTEYIKTRPVHKYTVTGEYIESYPTQAIAAKENPNSNITRCIKNKKPCYNGFLWALEQLPYYCTTQDKKKKVGKFDLSGNLIKTYESIKACSIEEGITHKRFISLGKEYKGYIYKCI